MSARATASGPLSARTSRTSRSSAPPVAEDEDAAPRRGLGVLGVLAALVLVAVGAGGFVAITHPELLARGGADPMRAPSDAGVTTAAASIEDAGAVATLAAAPDASALAAGAELDAGEAVDAGDLDAGYDDLDGGDDEEEEDEIDDAGATVATVSSAVSPRPRPGVAPRPIKPTTHRTAPRPTKKRVKRKPWRR